MSNKHYFLSIAIPIALFCWFFDAGVHFFMYGEQDFEVFPSDLDELWMRVTIFILMVGFGLFADHHTNEIAEKDVEKIEVYESMLGATQHILNNFLQSIVLYNELAAKRNDMDEKTKALFERAILSTTGQIENLKNIEKPSKEAIEEKFLPKDSEAA